MQSRFEQMQQTLDNYRNSDDPKFSWPEETWDKLFYKIKEQYSAAVALKFLELAADIFGSSAIMVKWSSENPPTLSKDIKTLWHLQGLLQASSADMGSLRPESELTITWYWKKNLGNPDKAIHPLSAIDVLISSIAEAIHDLETKFSAPGKNRNKTDIATFRRGLAFLLAIAWEECTGKQPACTPGGIFDKVLHLAYEIVGLPPRKNNKDIILANRPMPTNGNEPTENR